MRANSVSAFPGEYSISLSSALAISLLKNGVPARLVEARVIDEGQVVVNAITAGAAKHNS